MNSKLKNLIIIIVIVIIGVVLYNALFKKDAAPAGLVSTSSQSSQVGAGSELGKEFLTLLLNLKVITLDNSLLESDPFTRLQDFTKTLSPDTNPGRPNPFAPIGTEGALPATVVLSNPQPTPAPHNSVPNTPSTPTAIVQTVTATSLQSVSAVLNGILPQAVSGSTRWFEYGLAATALSTSTTQTTQSSSGSFGVQVSGLKSNTTYYFRAMAKVNGTTISGNVLTFKTK